MFSVCGYLFCRSSRIRSLHKGLQSPQYRIAQRALHNPDVSSAAFSGLGRSPTPVAPALLQLCEKLVGWHKKRVFLQQPPDNQHRMRLEDVH